MISVFLKKGSIVWKRAVGDRRGKFLFFTERGRKHARAILPFAAEAENRATAQWGIEKIVELVYRTTAYPESMEKEVSMRTEAML